MDLAAKGEVRESSGSFNLFLGGKVWYSVIRDDEKNQQASLDLPKILAIFFLSKSSHESKRPTNVCVTN